MTAPRRAPIARLFPEDEGTRLAASSALARASADEPTDGADFNASSPPLVLRWPRFRDCASLVRAGLLAPGECSEALIFEARKANILGRGLHLVVTHPGTEPRPVAVIGLRFDDVTGATLQRFRVSSALAEAARRGLAGSAALRVLRAALRPVLAAVFARWDEPLRAEARDGRQRRFLLALGFEEHEDTLRLTRAAAEAAGLLRVRRTLPPRQPVVARPLESLSRGFAFARSLNLRDGGGGTPLGTPAGRRLCRSAPLQPREAAP